MNINTEKLCKHNTDFNQCNAINQWKTEYISNRKTKETQKVSNFFKDKRKKENISGNEKGCHNISVLQINRK